MRPVTPSLAIEMLINEVTTQKVAKILRSDGIDVAVIVPIEFFHDTRPNENDLRKRLLFKVSRELKCNTDATSANS